MRDRYVVVSIHDVALSTLPEVRWLCAQLDRLGVDRRVLKVIPNERGDGDIRRSPDVIAFLHEEAQRGSEIVMHGFTHRTAGRLRGAPLDRLQARLFAPHDAEFLSLSDAVVVERLDAGRRILSDAGLSASGFCPPAWMGRRTLERALRSAGFSYSVRLGTIHDLERGTTARVPAVGYMGGGDGLEAITAVANALVTRARFDGLRVFLHPERASGSRSCAAVLRALPGWIDGRRITTYADVVNG